MVQHVMGIESGSVKQFENPAIPYKWIVLLAVLLPNNLHFLFFHLRVEMLPKELPTILLVSLVCFVPLSKQFLLICDVSCGRRELLNCRHFSLPSFWIALETILCDFLP